ncbi:MAG TPA: hypothetical protein ENJ34_04240 [Epsilonproteobacteria bacterium]|nr:hypothetical protein [Campylobacterota bacterium]
MTTMTLTIDDRSQDIIEAFKTIASNFQGVSFEIETTETKEEVLSSFRTAMKDIASGEAIKNARPVEELFKELAND